jgi:hypothetical protein
MTRREHEGKGLRRERNTKRKKHKAKETRGEENTKRWENGKIVLTLRAKKSGESHRLLDTGASYLWHRALNTS